MKNLKTDITSILSLFTSFSTLLCCALPALLVTLGLGAVMAGLVSNFPFLKTLSLYKEWTFFIAALLISFNFWLVYRRKPQKEACEIVVDGEESACDTASRWSKIILWLSAGLLFIGFFMAFLALPLIRYIDA
jgi:mercuric ion transport protein